MEEDAGSRALAFASRWFDPATVSRFEPLVGWQRRWQPRLREQPVVRMHGLMAFAIAAFVSSPAIIASAPPPSVIGRVIVRVVWFVMVVAMVLAIPLVLDGQRFGQAIPRLLFAAIPSGVVLAFPFSMLLAVDVIRRDRQIAPHVARATAVKLAFAAVVFMVIFHGFVMPAANQQFRLLASPDDGPPPRPGIREQTTIELISDVARDQPAERYTRSGAIRSELTNRAVLALMPAIFVWLRWIAHDVRRRVWPSCCAMVIVA